MTICREVRKVEGGFVAEVRWPYGGVAGGYGEVVCRTWEEVVALLEKAAGEDEDTKRLQKVIG